MEGKSDTHTSTSKILVNRFDYDEFIIYDGESYWADGEAHSRIGKCHDLDGLDYGTDNVFEEIPRTDFEAVVRTLVDIGPYAEELTPLLHATEVWACGAHRYCKQRNSKGFKFENEQAPPEILSAMNTAYRCAVEEFGNIPDTFFEFEYLGEHLPHLEKPPVPLPECVEIDPNSPPRVRYFQNKISPFDVIPYFDETYFVGARLESSLHTDSYSEVGPAAVRTIRRMGGEVRSSYLSSRRYVDSLRTLARYAEDLRDSHLPDEKLTQQLRALLDELAASSSALDEYCEKVRDIRSASLRLERALVRVANLSGDKSILPIPGYTAPNWPADEAA